MAAHTLLKELLRWDCVRFKSRAWAGDRRCARQKNVPCSTNTLSAYREPRQRNPRGFSLSLAFPLLPFFFFLLSPYLFLVFFIKNIQRNKGVLGGE